jgi:hypothetical protein
VAEEYLQVDHSAPGAAHKRRVVISMIRKSPDWIDADITYHLNNGGNRQPAGPGRGVRSSELPQSVVIRTMSNECTGSREIKP